jgi:hypothetical protein
MSRREGREVSGRIELNFAQGFFPGTLAGGADQLHIRRDPVVFPATEGLTRKKRPGLCYPSRAPSPPGRCRQKSRCSAVWGLDSPMSRLPFLFVFGRCFLVKPLPHLRAECPDAAGTRHGNDHRGPLRLALGPLKVAFPWALRTPAWGSESGRAAAARR